MPSRVTIAIYDAYGGPEEAFIAADGFVGGPTGPGEYLVAYCGRHASRRYPTWSKIPWGSPVKEEKEEVLVMYEGNWVSLFDLTSLTREEVLDYHESLYKVRKIPSTWVFNDFGHVTCFLYQDANRNGRVDHGEIHSEFIHTVPENEAQRALGQPVRLGESHGCIHVRPADIDSMIKRGFLRKNTPVVVHGYADRKVIFPRAGAARPPYEIHFFPGMKKLIVIGSAQ